MNDAAGTDGAGSVTNASDDGLGHLTLADGPWSFDEAPSAAAFIDFGPLKLPALPGLKALVEFDKATRKVGAVSVRVNNASVQLQVVSAARAQAHWGELRTALLKKLRSRPGTQQAHEGHFGPEIIASITGRRRDGLLADVPMRVFGVDGDRWVLRAVVTGADVMSDETVERVNALISHCAIERGDHAASAGTVLELTPPPGTPAADEAPEA